MINPIVKDFLKRNLQLIDNNKIYDFLDLVWEERLNNSEVKELFKILNSLDPKPIDKETIEDYFIESINRLILELKNITPEDWQANYHNMYPIDKYGDLHLLSLMQGFKFPNYGFSNVELMSILKRKGDKITTLVKDIYVIN